MAIMQSNAIIAPGNADCIINGHSSDGGPGAGLTLLNVVIRV